MTGPYAAACWDYRRAGWPGVLPLPAMKKTPVPAGWTGHKGRWPDLSDIALWALERPDGNVALRLDEAAFGMDVDHYGDKRGGDQLAELEALHGPLPLTVVSTSRTDGVSGIRLFSGPPGLWPSTVADHIEGIHFGHRYVVAPPSIHPSLRVPYRCINQRTGEVLDRIPHRDSLPALPSGWVAWLRAKATAPADKTTVDSDAAVAWLDALRHEGDPCDPVTRRLATALTDLRKAARHDTMLSASASLIGMGAVGHDGARQALIELQTAFIAAATDPTRDSGRSRQQAVQEWRRAIRGAIGIQVKKGRTAPSQLCYCLPAFVTNAELRTGARAA